MSNGYGLKELNHLGGVLVSLFIHTKHLIMNKLYLIGFLLALPTTVVTFFWLVSIGGFNWVEGMRCAPALIANGIALLASILIAIVGDDEECAVWVNNWRRDRI